MSADKDTGGQVFPHYPGAGYAPGMTQRDYFAAMALQGLTAAMFSNEVRQFFVDNATEAAEDELTRVPDPKGRVARAAYEYADAMLKASQA